MNGLGNYSKPREFTVKERVRACNYITVAQLFLQDNFLLERPLEFSDIKPRLLGHWGTCPGINQVYACLKAHYSKFTFVLGPGHGFPALQANLYYDGDLAAVDPRATADLAGLGYVCKEFSWPGGFPSHASPLTPGVICEGGELGYALGIAYGACMGHPEKTVAVLIGDGEFETATALASMNLNKLLSGPANGTVLPVLHLNGYKISAPTVYARKSERELSELIRGFGFSPLFINGEDPESFEEALQKSVENPFFVLKSEKGFGGPTYVNGEKIAGSQNAHQIPLKTVKTDEKERKILETWLKSYRFHELFYPEKGFTI